VELSIVVVNYRSGEPLRRLFDSSRRHPVAAEHEFIVVDNSPGDGVAEWLAETAPDVRVLESPENVGYARAVNAGIQAAHGRHILVLNPDIVLSDGGIDAALDYLEAHPECGIVGAKLLEADGAVQRSARRFYTLTTIVLRRTPLGALMPRHSALRDHLMLDDDLSEPRPVDWVMGAWMLVRREALNAVGGMDERFFLYFEDVDWCYRMWEAGYECHYFPGAEFHHEYQRSSSRAGTTMLHHLRSFFGFYDKWGALIYVAKRLRARIEVAAAVAGDALAWNLALLAAFLTRRALDPLFPEALFDLADYTPLILFTNLASLVVLPFTGRYRRPESTRRWTRWFGAIRAALFVALVVMAGTYLSHTRIFSRAVLLLFVPYLILLLEGIAVQRRRILGGVDDEFEGVVKRCVLLGDESAIERFLTAGSAQEGALVVGALTPDGEDVVDVRGLGHWGEAAEVVDRYHAREILLLGSRDQGDLAESVGRELAALGHRVLVRHEWLSGADDEDRELRFGLRWSIAERPAACGDGAWTKWLLDRPAGLLLSLLSLPGFVLCSALGRPFGLVQSHTHGRLGRRGRRIAWPELSWSRSGRPLWGIVQFPRFLQVLRGRLSLVGPYPLLESSEEELGAHQRLRFAVNPGLTGPWRHRLDHPSISQLTHDDLDYLEHWSFSLDLDLFLSALPQLLWSRKNWNGPPSAV